MLSSRPERCLTFTFVSEEITFIFIDNDCWQSFKKLKAKHLMNKFNKIHSV